MKKSLALLLMTCLAAFAAETIKLNAPELWKDLPQKSLERVTFTEESMTVAGRLSMFSSTQFDVDPAKSYTVSTLVKNLGPEDAYVLIGFCPLDANSKIIFCEAVRECKGSFTSLVKDAKKGDNVFFVKDASAWDAKTTSTCLALNAKEDYSDMPNNFRLYPIVKIEKLEDGTWRIETRPKLNQYLPAGTNVRQHYAGGYLYTAGAIVIKPGQERLMQGTIKGIDKPGAFTYNIWPIGTAKMRVLIFSNHYNKNSTIQYTTPKLTVQ